ncbi:MAG: S41 family peptidase [Caloramator sp.]|nr:S41 family peptidase [Caloramator sp.]
MRKTKVKFSFFIVGLLFFVLFIGILLNENVSDVFTVGNNLDLQELSTKEKLEDFDYLFNVLKDNYPYLEVAKRKTGFDWIEKKEEFKGKILKTKNNVEFYYAIDEILHLLQNAHTNIISPERYDLYRDAYKGSGNSAWRDVINNKSVQAKNRRWMEILPKSKKTIPIEFRYVEGKYVVYSSLGDKDYLKQHDIPRFSTLLSINGIEVDQYIKDNMNKMYLTYDFKRNKLKTNDFFISCNDNQMTELKFKTLDGRVVKRNLEGTKDENTNKYNINTDRVYETKIIKKDKIAYLKVWSFAHNYVERDKEGIYSFFKSIKDYPFLIIDIRGNGGGSEGYYMENIVPPLIKEPLSTQFYCLYRGDYIKKFLKSRKIKTRPIEKLPNGLKYPEETKKLFTSFLDSREEIKPKNPVGFKGKIFLLVDDYVYSSAEAFAAFCKATKFATLVGTTTGGDGIGMDPAVVALPNSGLLIRFPLDMGLNPDGTSNEEYHTQPDVYVEQSFDDFIKYVEYKEKNLDVTNPYDTVLNYVIEMIDDK